MSAEHESHEGPIKTPQQLLWTVFFSFVAPVFIIIGLVYFVLSYAKPGSSGGELSGLSQAEMAKSVEMRIAKVGTVEIRDANRPLATGETVFNAQCAACHAVTSVVAGAPKLNDAAAWAARIKTGYDALLNSALKGKGAMGAQGGGDWEDAEIGRALVYMTNSAGGSFPVPETCQGTRGIRRCSLPRLVHLLRIKK
ncbi:MAG: cytochrome c5 family protein [Brachymonas sp.]|nr:cytochrome c5 family protein [Brachymonas sp.]